MSESKFLPFQDTDGDLHNDKCKFDDVTPEERVCPECLPNESALVPDWKNASDPYLNERNCKYQIAYKTKEETTGYETGMSDDEAEEVLDGIYEDFAEDAITELLEFYNKETTIGAIALLKESIEYTDYDLLARYKSKLKLLYSVPYDVLNAVGAAEEDEEGDEDAGDIEVTYQMSDLERKIIRVRKGLNLYNRYYKIFSFTSDESQWFVYDSGAYAGKSFILEKYGDWGLGISLGMGPHSGLSRLELVYSDLVKFMKEKNYSIKGQNIFSSKELVSEITFTFDSEYNIKKMTFNTIRCGTKDIVFTGKLKALKKLDGWKDKTAVAYFAQLDSMDTDLQARTPKPWIDFITEYTYPPVVLTGANQALAAVQTSAGCVSEAIGDAVFDMGLLDAIDFSISDAIAVKWYDSYCQSSEEDLNKMQIQLGLAIAPIATATSAATGGSTLPKKIKFKDLKMAAAKQAHGAMKSSAGPFDMLCLKSGRNDFDFPKILGELKVCGLSAALTEAITCLFGGLTLEQALARVAEAALKGMNIQKLNDLFIGLPPEQREELDALAKQKLQQGQLFASDSTNQAVSDAIAKNDFETLEDLNGRLEDDSYFRVKDEEDNREDRVDGWFDSGITSEGSTDPNVKKRTLVQKLENPSEGEKIETIQAAYVAALLEYYADNLLDLVDQLNRFPGARLIVNSIMAIDCPVPPLFNPTVFDFIKDLELPFCRNIDDITLPKLVNPFSWITDFSDISAALFDALKKLIIEMAIAILVKLMLKLCEILSNAICKTLEAAGDLASSVATGAGRETFSAMLRDALCGEGADDEQINDTIVEMFANFGVGAEAFADQEQTIALAESMANIMTQKELASAFLGDMSEEAESIIREVVDADYPQYKQAFSRQGSVGQMFESMGKIFDGGFKDSLRDLVDGTDSTDRTPVNASLCASPELLEEFCEARTEILNGRASPEQISKLCDSKIEPRALSDLQAVLDGGIGDYIANNMPPITSDPGCNNGILPYEPEETIAATTSTLGYDLELLKIDYSTDMIGNGPLEKNWGLVNMMMSDTEGFPLTAHVRKSGMNPFYVDQYGTFFPDPSIIAAAGLVSPIAAVALRTLDQSRRTGAYPEKVAAYLQSYMNGEVDEGIISIDYNNSIQSTETVTVDYVTSSGYYTVATPYLSDTAYGTDAEYVYGLGGSIDYLQITFEARKSDNDIKLSFSDYARGYRQLGESEYEYGFDIEVYTAEVREIRHIEDGHQVVPNIYSDNMRIKISERINLSAKSYDPGTTPDPSLAEGMDADEILSLAGGNNGTEAIDPSEILDLSSDSDPNSDLNVETTIKYQFLSVDDTFAELGDILEEYPTFQSAFTSEKGNQPQSILLSEMIEDGTGLSASDMENYRSETTKIILEDIFKVIADTESEITAWEYGAELEVLTQEDTDYGINDNGTWILYKDTDLINEDMVLGISYDQYKNEISGTLDKTRVFYLDPTEFGGTYKSPGIYVKPSEFKGWFGLIDVLFPDYSPCKPNNTDLVDFGSIQDKVGELYPNIPEDERLKSDPDCIIELPYNRVLTRSAKAAMIGLIMASCRMYASAHIIKTLPTFAQFSPRFPEVFSSAYASYIIEDMEDSFKNARGADWQLFNGFSDQDFWYGFLEQCVQMYSYRVDIGEFEPPEEVLNALMRLNDLQESYEYPKSRADVRGDIEPFQSLKNYRLEKNLEAIKQTQDDAKIVMKEWIVEQLSLMSQKLITSLESVGFSPKIKDIDYYMLENFAAGSSLTINETMDSFGMVQATYGDLPTIPWEDNDETEVIEVNGVEIASYYTYGAEFVVKESEGTADSLEVGQEYVGSYHVHINETGDVIYMAGESHQDTLHSTLSPISNVLTVAIGDIAEINTVTNYDKPFLIEKYISIDGEKMTTTAAIDKINSNSDLTQLISDVYPGTMQLIYSRSPTTQTPNSEGTPVGIKGELGVRYGLKFSCIVGGIPREATSVEIDALDLSLSEFKTLSANSLNLYCLVKELKNDPKFKMISRYIIPINKLTSLAAIYNDMAMLPSIGQFIVNKQNLFATSIEDVLAGTAGMLPTEINTGLEEITVANLEIDRATGAWVHPDDRKNRKGLFVLSWDNWSRDTLVNSTSRIKKLFKTYYKSRDFGTEEMYDDVESPGKLFEKKLKEALKPAAGRQLLPWFKRRKLKDNPFNSLGEICKKDD
tara:strand:+ start:672 stop:7235 length:6564 start_codon:yes stop_codon:yes gene_type:complete